MYNETYIACFSEEVYLNFLRNPKNLFMILDQYLKKYSGLSDATYLTFKDSLDHYVAKQLAQNPNYIHTLEFKNYAKYLKDVIFENKIISNTKPIYLEFNTNVVFQYMSSSMLQAVYPNNHILEEIKRNQQILDAVFLKISSSQILNDMELRFLAKYFDNKKDFSDPRYQQFIQYIFSHLSSVSSFPEVLSSILSFLPYFYDSKVKDSRIYFATYDGLLKDGTPHMVSLAYSKYRLPIVCFSFDYFQNISMNSFQSIQISRILQHLDMGFFLFVAFHELAHQFQQNDLKNGSAYDTLAYAISKALDQTHLDQQRNHDSDEVEIEADEKGWIQCSIFISKYLKNDQLAKQCRNNAKAVKARRAFSVKIDSQGNIKRYMDYDIEKLIEGVQKDPQVLIKFPILNTIIDEKGRIKTDFLFQKVISKTPAGRELCNYTFNHVPLNLLIHKIQNKEYRLNQITTLLSNFVEVPHANALTLRDLKDIDLKTYDETRTGVSNLKQKIEEDYNLYFIECGKQFQRFVILLEVVSFAYPNFQKMKESYLSFFLSYYDEMLQNIKKPDIPSIVALMKEFEDSNIPYLIELSNRTQNYMSATFPLVYSSRSDKSRST